MISFKSILKEKCVSVGVAASTKDAALAAAVDLLLSGDPATDRERLLAEIRSREALSSTGIGEGTAVPHALCDFVRTTSLCVVRLAEPVPFGSVDGLPVDLLFLMVGPRGDSAVHLRLLSKLARLLHDESFRAAARSAEGGSELARLLYDRD